MSRPDPSQSETNNPSAEREAELEQVRQALHGLRFGSVNVIVQDGVVVQIDRTEKTRLRWNETK